MQCYTNSIFIRNNLNIMNEAKKLEKVIVGLLTNEAIASYKRFLLIPYDKRKIIVENCPASDEIGVFLRLC